MASAAATAATARATTSTARTCSVRASASAPTGSPACLPDLRTGRPARARARQASASEAPVVMAPRRGAGRRPTPRMGAATASREEGPGGGAAAPTADQSRRPLAIHSRPLAGHAVGPTAVAADARAVVVGAAPEMGRTSWRAWRRTRRQRPRQAWRPARAVPATARRWMLRKARRPGVATSRQAPSASTTVAGGKWRASCRTGRGAEGHPQGARWSPAVVVATATRMRTHRARRAAVKTGAVPSATVSHFPPLLVTDVAISMSAAATERGVRPLTWSGPPALCRTTKAGGRAKTTRRCERHGRRRGWRRGGGHVGVVVGVLAATRRGRRTPGTVTIGLRAPPP